MHYVHIILLMVDTLCIIYNIRGRSVRDLLRPTEMAMFTGYFEASENFNVENRREKFIILIGILYPICSILIRSQFLLCFLRELLMSF